MADELKPVFVTGAGGFIGSHLVEELLNAGHHVRALVHYNALGKRGHLDEVVGGLGKEALARLEVQAGDIRDARCVRTLARGCQAVYHLAALIGIPYSYEAPQSYVATNILGTLNVLEACRDEGVSRLIHTSTSEVYGTALTTPMDEAHPLQAQSPYSATKIAADKLVESYIRSFELPAVTVRPFNTYGPRQSLRAVIPTIISQALSKSCEAIELGSTEPVRDFTYVGDTVRGFQLAGAADDEKVLGYTFNLGTGTGISIGSLARLILETLKIEKEIKHAEARDRPHLSEVRTLISNNSLVKRQTAWEPKTELKDGVLKTADWLKAHLGQINPKDYVR